MNMQKHGEEERQHRELYLLGMRTFASRVAYNYRRTSFNCVVKSLRFHVLNAYYVAHTIYDTAF